MTRGIQYDISAGAILLFALLYFIDVEGAFSALVPAVCVHELGHVLALLLCRCRIRRITISIFGAELDYAPQIFGFRAVLCAASGPLFGAIYAIAACRAGGRFLCLSGAISFLLSAFNCLPILPLDGGRIISLLLSQRQAGRISSLCPFLVLSCSLCAAFRTHMLSQMLMGIWLVACNLRSFFRVPND